VALKKMPEVEVLDERAAHFAYKPGGAIDLLCAAAIEKYNPPPSGYMPFVFTGNALDAANLMQQCLHMIGRRHIRKVSGSDLGTS
jgi:hypothetical protein